MIKRKLMMYLMALGFAIALNPAQADHQSSKAKRVKESIELSDLFVFGTENKVNGAITLIRDFDNKEIRARMTSNAFVPDTAYSIWWAVFNRPQYCLEPYRCSTADLAPTANPKVRPSVFWAGGFVADSYGNANTSMVLKPGRTSRELFAGTKNYGLQKLRSAEIHVAIRTHGPAGVAGSVANQIGTSFDACPASGCTNDFVSFHPVRN